jgi:hypothetical protein
MSTLRRICDVTKRTAIKIATKAEELADSATQAVKIKNLEMKIEEKYEDLGRLIYRDLHTEDDLEEEKLRIIAEIDALFDTIATLKETPAEEATAEEATATEAASEETPAE